MTTRESMFASFCGVACFLANVCGTSISAACDMYSMGIILNETYSRKRPYIGEDADLKTLLSQICDRRINKRPTMCETIPPRKRFQYNTPGKREIDILQVARIYGVTFKSVVLK